MFDFLFGTTRKIRNFASIHSVEKAVEKYMAMSLENLKNERDTAKQNFGDSPEKEKLIGEIFTLQGGHEIAKLRAMSAGAKVLTEVDKERSRYRDLKAKLLAAAKG